MAYYPALNTQLWSLGLVLWYPVCHCWILKWLIKLKFWVQSTKMSPQSLQTTCSKKLSVKTCRHCSLFRVRFSVFSFRNFIIFCFEMKYPLVCLIINKFLLKAINSFSYIKRITTCILSDTLQPQVYYSAKIKIFREIWLCIFSLWKWRLFDLYIFR